jgi:glycosyltransferase involved in cell wall biosynthesis
VTSKLAIVIPAYKSDYLEATLESLAYQSSKDFTLYVADDASPADISTVVDSFSSRLNLRYHRFETNMGQRDLVAHWERCIALTRDEEWIWLFSDDDLMDTNCVETFLQAEARHGTEVDLFRFRLDVIDGRSTLIQHGLETPAHFGPDYFLRERYVRSRLRTTVVEFVFSRRIHASTGGFVNFPLAWHSDDATWLKFGRDRGICTVPGARVYWRASDWNISTLNSPVMVEQKLESALRFDAFLVDYLLDGFSRHLQESVFRSRLLSSRTMTHAGLFWMLKAVGRHWSVLKRCSRVEYCWALIYVGLYWLRSRLWRWKRHGLRWLEGVWTRSSVS